MNYNFCVRAQQSFFSPSEKTYMKVFPVCFLCVLLLLSGCASQIPLEIREPPAASPLFSQVRDDPKAYQGQPVRWGGTIVKVENRPTETWVEVLAKELGSEGRPVESDASLGRFLMKAIGFLDPVVYRTDRRITVYGRLAGQETRKIGDLPYTYPVVQADTYYLWSERRYYDYPPYWYYPYYYPYYPYPRFHFGFYRGWW